MGSTKNVLQGQRILATKDKTQIVDLRPDNPDDIRVEDMTSHQERIHDVKEDIKAIEEYNESIFNSALKDENVKDYIVPDATVIVRCFTPIPYTKEGLFSPMMIAHDDTNSGRAKFREKTNFVHIPRGVIVAIGNRVSNDFPFKVGDVIDLRFGTQMEKHLMFFNPEEVPLLHEKAFDNYYAFNEHTICGGIKRKNHEFKRHPIWVGEQDQG